jgi:hypothetical protein
LEKFLIDMDLKGIISISGMSGLYKVVAQAKNGFIVESLADKRRFPITSSQRISALEDISIYATDADIPLREIFLKIREQNGSGLPVSNKSDNKALNEYFRSVVPNFDEERVYPSDIKKVVTWYEILKDKVDWEAKEQMGTDVAEEKGITEDKAVKPKPSKKKGKEVTENTGKEKKENTRKAATTARTRKKV